MTSDSGSRPPRPDARTFLASVLEPGSFVSWDEPPASVAGPGSRYAAELAAAAEKAGTDEAVVTGAGRIGSHRVAVIAGEFGFLAGSIGVSAARRIVAAFERAATECLPILAAPASGGTRMQEGTPAFVGMVSIASAVAAYREKGLPYVTYLRHPTTGGVLASWGSLGQLTFAEPGATIGFLGARVYEALYGEPFPTGVQTAENLAERGVLDAVLPLADVAPTVGRLLDLLDPAEGARAVPDATAPGQPIGADQTWDAVTRSREHGRPGVRELLRFASDGSVELSGTGAGERDPALVLAVTSFGGTPCVLIGQDRDPGLDPLGPGGLRTARRGMRLAAELGVPLVSVVDTAGAALSAAAENGAIAGEIARCLADLVTLPVPTVSVLLGQGTGGGALALLPADHVLCAQHGWVSPLPPEGASAILYRTADRAAELAQRQGVGSESLLTHRIVDEIIAEEPDAAQEPEDFSRRVGAALARALGDTTALAADARLAARHTRFRWFVDGGGQPKG